MTSMSDAEQPASFEDSGKPASEFDWDPMDDTLVEMESAGGLRHPMTVASVFLQLISQDSPDVIALGQIVTPESETNWGDFTGARDMYRAIDYPGVGSAVKRGERAADVAWVKVVHGATEPRVISTPTLLRADIITLVWRPELDSWRVHQWGPPAKPDSLGHVRTSPNLAP